MLATQPHRLSLLVLWCSPQLIATALVITKMIAVGATRPQHAPDAMTDVLLKCTCLLRAALDPPEMPDSPLSQRSRPSLRVSRDSQRAGGSELKFILLISTGGIGVMSGLVKLVRLWSSPHLTLLLARRWKL